MQWIDIEQNTDEWLALRAGKIGGSSIGKVMANFGKSFGQPAKDLAAKIAIEQITGKPIMYGYSNFHMERGHEQEPIARGLYEEASFSDVNPGGYYTDDILVGVSPDGLVYNDGIIEIKSVIASVQYQTVKRGGFDPKYTWQVYYNLLHSGRDWLDYVSYCADFPEGRRLHVARTYRDDCEKFFAMIAERMDEFAKEVEEAKFIITNGA